MLVIHQLIIWLKRYFLPVYEANKDKLEGRVGPPTDRDTGGHKGKGVDRPKGPSKEEKRSEQVIILSD